MVAEFESRLDRIARSIRSKLAQNTRNAIVVGMELLEARDIIGHGYWGEWLKKEFEWSESTARNYMNVARQFGNADHSAVLSISAKVAYLLAAPSTPDEARAEAFDTLEKTGELSAETTREIISKHQPETVTVIAEESPYYRQSFEVVKRSGGMIEARSETGETVGLLKNWVEQPLSADKKPHLYAVPQSNPLQDLSDHNHWLESRVKLLEEFISESVIELRGIVPHWCDRASRLIGGE